MHSFYKLIADAGSSKTDWVAIGQDGDIEGRLNSSGLNALLADSKSMNEFFNDAKSHLGDGCREAEIHFYGAGCATPEICRKVEDAILQVWPESKPVASSDLLGAARSLLGKSKGIACILGTGSNSCLYDGSKIIGNIPSLGFILGDEGSGAALGKRLITDAFKGYLPKSVKVQFLDKYKLTLGEILDKVYREPAPNRFLASLVPFIKENLWNPYLYGMVIKEFSHFFRRNVAMYPDCKRVPICFTGSIAWHFAHQLEEAAETQGFRISKITKSPIEGIAAFHGALNPES